VSAAVAGPVAQAFGLTDPREALGTLAGISALGFDAFLVVEDPDGNLVEVQPVSQQD